LQKHCDNKEKAMPYFNHDHTHSSLKGAKMNARNIAVGLKQIHSKLAEFLK
jgi:hypothetical protein